MKKAKKAATIAICALFLLWGAMFTTDYVRCSSLKRPLFVVSAESTADDGGSGTYRGLGYTVDMEVYIDAEYGLCVSAVEMKVLGKVVAASIS